MRVEKWLTFGKYATVFLSTIFFMVICILCLMGEIKPNEQATTIQRIFGTLFFTLFVLMGLSNFYLMTQMRSWRKRQSINENQGTFKNEKRMLLIILIMFEVSYLIRFLVDFSLHALKDQFTIQFLIQLVFLSDGITFFALLIFHCKNYKPVGQQQLKE